MRLLVEVGREHGLGDDGGADEPGPDQEVQVDVVPDGHEGEDGEDADDSVLVAAERDEDVPDEPLVEAAVPPPPELLEAVVVQHASVHVLHHFDPVDQSPGPGDAPKGHELQPKSCRIPTITRGKSG